MELHNNRVGDFCKRIKSQQSDLAIKIPVSHEIQFSKKNQRWFASFFIVSLSLFFLENWISHRTGIFLAGSDCWDLILLQKSSIKSKLGWLFWKAGIFRFFLREILFIIFVHSEISENRVGWFPIIYLLLWSSHRFSCWYIKYFWILWPTRSSSSPMLLCLSWMSAIMLRWLLGA